MDVRVWDVCVLTGCARGWGHPPAGVCVRGGTQRRVSVPPFRGSPATGPARHVGAAPSVRGGGKVCGAGCSAASLAPGLHKASFDLATRRLARIHDALLAAGSQPAPRPMHDPQRSTWQHSSTGIPDAWCRTAVHCAAVALPPSVCAGGSGQAGWGRGGRNPGCLLRHHVSA
jgi:hypothetical protein